PPGFSRGQLEAETVIIKFGALTAPYLAQRVRDRIIEAVMALDESASCAELMAALATDSAATPERSRSASASGSGGGSHLPACARRRGRALRARAREPPSKRDNSRVDGIRRRSASDSVSSAARFAMSASSVRRVAAMSPGSTRRRATALTSSAKRTSLVLRPRLRSQIDRDFLGVRRARPARDVPQFSHAVERRDRGRLHAPRLVAQLPLRKAFGLPQNAQEGPVPIRDRVFGEPHLQGAGEA